VGYCVRRLAGGFEPSRLGPPYFVATAGTVIVDGALRASFEKGGADRVRSLYTGVRTSADVWYRGDDWGLSIGPLL
jgi:hypothetical protein